MASECNIRVVCRFRPMNARERADAYDGGDDDVRFSSEQTVVCMGKSFNLDFVQPPEDEGAGAEAQRSMYEHAASVAVEDVLNGYNGTIFAYGQTGAGKTWTMFGPARSELSEMSGVIPRSVARVFEALEHKTREGSIVRASVQASFLEIYCEEIYDLLEPKSAEAGVGKLKLHETPSQGVWVAGLREVFVSSAEEALRVIEAGDKNRSVAATQMNAESSRSHSVFMLNIAQTMADGTVKLSRLNLADLAGSEKLKKTGATGQTLQEAKKINQSLSALGNCINAISSAKPFVPYRDSKLTHLLRESLGGNTKSTLIVCCSPHPRELEESVSTLRFAERAKTIRTTVKQNVIRSRAELEKTIERLRLELRALKAGGKAGAGGEDEEEGWVSSRDAEAALLREEVYAATQREKDLLERDASLQAGCAALEEKRLAFVATADKKLAFFEQAFQKALRSQQGFKEELLRAQEEVQTQNELKHKAAEQAAAQEKAAAERAAAEKAAAAKKAAAAAAAVDGDEEDYGEDGGEDAGETESGVEADGEEEMLYAMSPRGREVASSMQSAHEQIRTLLREKEEMFYTRQRIKETNHHLEDDIMRKVDERDALLERLCDMEAAVLDMQRANTVMESMAKDQLIRQKRQEAPKSGASAKFSALRAKLRREIMVAPACAGVLKEGWLEKKGEVRTSWKKRWCMLTLGTAAELQPEPEYGGAVGPEPSLLYFKKDSPAAGKKANGRIGLLGADIVVVEPPPEPQSDADRAAALHILGATSSRETSPRQAPPGAVVGRRFGRRHSLMPTSSPRPAASASDTRRSSVRRHSLFSTAQEVAQPSSSLEILTQPEDDQDGKARVYRLRGPVEDVESWLKALYLAGRAFSVHRLPPRADS